MSKIIIGLTGLIASGKDVSKKYLIEKYGASSHRFSQPLRDILTRLYLPATRSHMQTLSLDLRTRFGSEILAQVISTDLKNDPREIVIIDGIRRQDDIKNLQNFPGFYLVSIEADPTIRYKRVVKRQENPGDDKKTWEEFLFDEQQEAELQIPAVMKTAKYTLDNTGTLPELYAQIDQIMAKIKQ